MTNLFPRYDDDPADLARRAVELDALAAKTDTFRHDLDGQTRQAAAEAWGELTDHVEAGAQPVLRSAQDVALHATLVAGCLRAWGTAVMAYNDTIDQQNRVWRSAMAENRHVPHHLVGQARVEREDEIRRQGLEPVTVASLQPQVDRAELKLDTDAEYVANLLAAGPTQASLQSLFGAGYLPPTVPLLFPQMNLTGGSNPLEFAYAQLMMLTYGPVRDLALALAKLPPEALEALGVNSPRDLADLAGRWVFGTEEDRAQIIDQLMQHPEGAELVYQLFGFHYVANGDFYTTGESSLQSYFGFHDAYNHVEGPLGMDLHAQKFEFTSSNGNQYRLELWKGTYGYGSSFGGEIGFYSRGPDSTGMRDNLEEIPGYYSTAQGDDQIVTTQTIYNRETGEEYFTNHSEGADGTDQEHYWNLGIRSEPGHDPSDLAQRGTIEAQDETLEDELYAAMESEAAANPSLNLRVWRDGPDGPIHYTWEQEGE